MDPQEELIPLTQKDSHYEPPEDEVIGYAEYLGFVFPEDEKLLYLAKEGLKADLPPGWIPCTNKEGQILYKNLTSGEVMEEHPLDQVYREKFQREKKRVQILESQKQRIFQENESQINASQTFGLMKTSVSQLDRSVTLSPIMKHESIERQKSESLESVRSQQQEQEIQSFPIGLNFVVNQSKALPPENSELSEMSGTLGEKYSKVLREEFGKVTPGSLWQREHIYQTVRTQKLARDNQSLNQEVREKQRILDQLTRQRIRKQKELIQMEEEFELQKQQSLEAYRKKFRQKIQREKRRKEEEFESTFKGIVAKHSNDLQKTLKNR